jgi:hypothetical protein
MTNPNIATPEVLTSENIGDVLLWGYAAFLRDDIAITEKIAFLDCQAEILEDVVAAKCLRRWDKFGPYGRSVGLVSDAVEAAAIRGVIGGMERTRPQHPDFDLSRLIGRQVTVRTLPGCSNLQVLNSRHHDAPIPKKGLSGLVEGLELTREHNSLYLNVGGRSNRTRGISGLVNTTTLRANVSLAFVSEQTGDKPS